MLCRKNAIKGGSGAVPVHLNVYDLTPINGYAYWFGLGVYHSGVQVHEVEYAFGAHEHPSTGIFEGEPKQCDGFRFRKSILIGWTVMGPMEVRRVMENLSQKYKGNAYNLITKNCNHFCNDACIRLTGNPIPSWVNRLARIGLLCNCVIPVSIKSTKVGHHRIEDKICEEDKIKLRSGSNRFTSTSSNSSSSSLSSPASATTSSRNRRSVLPSSPLNMGHPSSNKSKQEELLFEF
ncbi:DeSI-like protein [Camellia lanceoleosa]|uniref:DeSI-like protein n=1 Tax=Camellia lanceoleosa TaxID=1840588 RepID=A0ACC0I3U0_9ERIC|nr:DeSI-like protein [Camellia lanceoleosa]